MSNREELEKSWARTRAHLRQASSLLPRSPVESDGEGRLDRYRESLKYDELELALNELEGLGENNPVPREFWTHLYAAAREMKLHEHVTRYEKKLSD